MGKPIDESYRENCIQPYHRNPRYWQYKGKPILLFGGSNRDNLFQWANEGGRLTEHLDLLIDCGGNYVRCTMSNREYTEGGYRWDLLPHPFKRLADGRHNLEGWNDMYWSKLRSFLTETHRRGIIVQLELWDMWNESGDSEDPTRPAGWYYSPWNPSNNVNYDWKDSPLLESGDTGFYNRFHLAVIAGDSVLVPYQERFVARVVDECIDYDHVLYQIDNESGIDMRVGRYWVRFVAERYRSANKKAYVCDSRRFHWPSTYETRQFQDWANPEIRDIVTDPNTYSYCDISQNNGNPGQQQYDNLIWYLSKVKEHGLRPVNHIKCYNANWPTGEPFSEACAASLEEAGSKFWRAVFAGAASMRFHRRTPMGFQIVDGFGLGEAAQMHLRSMRMFVDSVNLFEMMPDNGVLGNRTSNEAYALVNPCQEYAVYFTGEGQGRVSIDLSCAVSSLTERWLDVQGNKWCPTRQAEGGKLHTLVCPSPGQWIAVLTVG